MSSPGHGSSGARVILVGRTGLDQSLRASPEIELLRVRSTIDAIGELAQPIDDESPARAIVVVGDSDGEELDARQREARAAEFVAAARRVEPGVVVVGVSGRGADVGGSGVSAFDGVVGGASDVLLLARRNGSPDGNGHAGGNGSVGGVESLISSILRPGPIGSTPSAAGHAIGDRPASAFDNDAPVVQAALRGEEILGTAIDMIRVRTGAANAVFVAASAEARSAPAGGVPVLWGEATFGWLVAPGLDPAVLSRHASWLAGWLRLRDQQAELRTAAFRDPLTGAWNRRYFDRFLASAMQKCRETRRTLTLMVFDIDDFKKYNDRYGHAAGDEILAETVRLMTSVVRPTDRVCRIGGDEFGVIFFEPDGPREQNSRHPDSVCKIAARFQQQIARHRFPKLGSEAPGSLSISGGLATFPWDGATVEQLMCRADERSMESKKSGKNALTLGPSAIRQGE